MIYPIHLYGHPVLRKATTEITPEYPNLSEVIDDMFATLAKASGVGLAAPQVGLAIRLFIVDLDPFKDEHPEYEGVKKVIINPKFLEKSEETASIEEGCLSIPDINEKVERPKKVKIKYYDENFVEHIEEHEDWMARVMQHEFDHIDAHLFIDRISPLRRRLIKGKLTAIHKRKVVTKYKSI
ncbi:MAG: peptide deformylase [Bacteroidales bacterium]|jgi:peptide deformylase|nr:peptide deformylase [Bacteroidales bacterium]